MATDHDNYQPILFTKQRYAIHSECFADAL